MAKRRWWLVIGALILAVAVSIGALAVQGRRTERRLDGLRAELRDVVGSLPRSPAPTAADEALIAALVADRIADRETSRKAGDAARAERLVSLALSPPAASAPPSPAPDDGSATLALADAVRRLTDEATRAAADGRPEDAVRFLRAARRVAAAWPALPESAVRVMTRLVAEDLVLSALTEILASPARPLEPYLAARVELLPPLDAAVMLDALAADEGRAFLRQYDEIRAATAGAWNDIALLRQKADGAIADQLETDLVPLALAARDDDPEALPEMWTSFAQSLREATARRLALTRGLDALAARAAGREWADIASEFSDAECEARADESGLLFTPAAAPTLTFRARD